MGRAFDRNYHLKGGGTICGSMICEKCKREVDPYSHDWMSAKRTIDGDWRYASWHRDCFPNKKGWEDMEREIRNTEKRAQDVVRLISKYKNEDGTFANEVYIALDELGLL